MKKILLLAFLAYLSPVHSQKDYSYVYNADSIIKKGIELHDKEKYADAIKEYEKVNKIDPKYTTAQYEKLLSLVKSDKKEDARKMFESLYKEGAMSKEPNMYVLYGSFMSDEKKYEEAEKIYNEAEKLTPNSTNLLYNKAVLYIRMEQRQKSIDILERIITNNPNSASSHYLLGLMAFEEGKIVQGTLAFLSYLAIAPTGSRIGEVIQRLNAKYGENFLEEGKLVFSKTGDNFEEIETILRNELPLKKAYKVNSQIDDVIIRQVQAVADYSLEHKMGNGFFETTYMPWIKDMMERKQFEGLSYYILLGLEEQLGKKLTSQKKKITDFYTNYYQNEFWQHFAKRKLDMFGKQEEVTVFLENNRPYIVGAEINGKKEGKQKLLNEYENVIAELNTKNGELDGQQKYYDDEGHVTSESTFSNGKLDGKRTTYFSNGMVNIVENYKDGELNGVTTTYYVNGGKQCETNFVKGKRDGKFTCLYPNGGKKLEIDYKDGKLDGKYISYNNEGHIDQSYTYTNDELNGKGYTYYDGKSIKTEANYANGKVQGSFKRYYSNGALKEELTYENGKLKKGIEYRANGKTDTESIYDEKEELELYTLFDGNGEKYLDQKFKSGDLKSGLQYSRNNPKPVEFNLTKKAFVINGLDGKTQISGSFEKGRKSGEWIYYTTAGIMKSKSNYKLGRQEGISQNYDRGGLLSSVAYYVNDSINGTNEVFNFGKLKKKYNYYKGVTEGPYAIYNSDGSLQAEGFYKEGELANDRITYWQNGTIARRDKFLEGNIVYVETFNLKGEKENTMDYKNKSGVFTQNYSGVTTHTFELKNGELNGKYTVKDKANTPIVESEFVNGMRTKAYKSYGPLGLPGYEMTYYDGNQHGLEKTYDLAGNLRLTEEYTFGDENGKATRYFHNKSKMYEYTQLDGDIEGEFKYYNQKGEPILILGYQNNDLKYYIKKGKTGELTEKVPVENQTATITSNYPNGKVAIQVQFVKGNKENKFGIYNAEGKPELLANYKNDIFDGERTEYYANGNLYKKERFSNNDYEGIQEYYKEDGKPWIKAAYKNDELHGDTQIYNNGVLASTKKYNSDDLVEISK